MARRKRTARPSDPIVIARRRAAERQAARDPATWGLNAEALGLAANVSVTMSPPAPGAPRRIRRRDLFDGLQARGALGQRAVDAVRRLQADMAILHRTLSCADWSPRIDVSRNPAEPGEARLAAGRRIAAVLTRSGGASARLLDAVISAEAGLGPACHWRAAVEQVSGERLADAQGAILRMACANLADAYADLDRDRGRAAAR